MSLCAGEKQAFISEFSNMGYSPAMHVTISISNSRV